MRDGWPRGHTGSSLGSGHSNTLVLSPARDPEDPKGTRSPTVSQQGSRELGNFYTNSHHPLRKGWESISHTPVLGIQAELLTGESPQAKMHKCSGKRKLGSMFCNDKVRGADLIC